MSESMCYVIRHISPDGELHCTHQELHTSLEIRSKEVRSGDLIGHGPGSCLHNAEVLKMFTEKYSDLFVSVKVCAV
jgi:hypothetical protein